MILKYQSAAYELGLIYKTDIENTKKVNIEMTWPHQIAQ